MLSIRHISHWEIHDFVIMHTADDSRKPNIWYSFWHINKCAVWFVLIGIQKSCQHFDFFFPEYHHLIIINCVAFCSYSGEKKSHQNAINCTLICYTIYMIAGRNIDTIIARDKLCRCIEEKKNLCKNVANKSIVIFEINVSTRKARWLNQAISTCDLTQCNEFIAYFQ